MFPKTSPARILIIEDDLDLAEMLTTFFRRNGYLVQSVQWGEDAVGAALNERPDLILLDIRLPDIDGYEVAQRIRNTPRLRHIPIIFVTERRSRSDRLHGLELGADDYITKPFDIHELLLRVRNSFQRARQPNPIHPATGLAIDSAVTERLNALAKQPGLGMLVAGLKNWDIFRERYGFVAADDVLRTLGKACQDITRSLNTPDGFVGHLSSPVIILLLPDEDLEPTRQTLEKQLSESIPNFYPQQDRTNLGNENQSMRLHFLLYPMASIPNGDGSTIHAALLQAFSV